MRPNTTLNRNDWQQWSEASPDDGSANLQNVEAEQQVIGMLVTPDWGALKGKFMEAAFHLLAPMDFTGAFHGAAWNAVVEYTAKGFAATEIDPVLVDMWLTTHGNTADTGANLAYLRRIAEEASYTTAQHALQVVRDCSFRRRLSNLADLTANAVRVSEPVDMAEVLRRAEEDVQKLRESYHAGGALYQSAAEVPFTPTFWCWEQWLARGIITILAGEPELGKSAVALYLAAAITGQVTWPGETLAGSETGPVVWVETEGALNLTLERVHNWGLRKELLVLPGADGRRKLKLDKPNDLAELGRLAVAAKASMIVLDSLGTAHTGDENSARMGDFVSELASLAEKTALPFVIIHHPRKLQALEPPVMALNRLAGSRSIGAIARVVWGIDKPDHESDVKRLSVIKSNPAPKPPAIGYRQEDAAFPVWCEAPQTPGQLSQHEKAMALVRSALQSGPVTEDDIARLGKSKGMTLRQLRAAGNDVGIVSVKRAGETYWAYVAEGY